MITRKLTLDLVLEIAQQVIDNPAIGAQDNFFEMGGDSLDALEFCTQIELATNVEVPMEAIWDEESFEALASALTSRSSLPSA